MMQKSAPTVDAFELSLFGCGVGESLALHLGRNEWVIVDSCRLSKSDEPLPLSYLRECGIDPASAVKLIVLTHWHDDHVDGAAAIVEACPNARVAISAAYAVDEFAQILGLFELGGRIVDRRTSGVHELARVMQISDQRVRGGRRADTRFAPVPAQADHLLFRSGESELIALAPSPGSIHVARTELQALITDLLSTPDQARVLPRSDRNDYSIALWLKCGDLRVLLSGDLEVSADPGRGWSGVMSCQQFPDRKASILKISHHGSVNGDEPRVWNELVAPTPLAVMTSYTRGINPLPTPADLDRIKQRTGNLYYTALPSKSLPRRERAVEKTIDAVALKRRILYRAAGHVRVRWGRSEAAPIVECSGTAKAA
jgi:beta-lactamase superfamily II metal-dependent hydrolase